MVDKLAELRAYSLGLAEYVHRVEARGEMTPQDVALLIEGRLEWVEKAGDLLREHRAGRGPAEWRDRDAAA